MNGKPNPVRVKLYIYCGVRYVLIKLIKDIRFWNYDASKVDSEFFGKYLNNHSREKIK